MQSTELLELNACITFMRTGKQVSSDESDSLYDMTWTFTAPRDPAIAEFFSGSPGDDAWKPTTVDLKEEQKRKRDDELRRTTTPQPISKQVQGDGKGSVTPVPLTGLKAPIEFKKKPVYSRAAALQQQKSVLSAELNMLRKQGGAVGGGIPAAQAASNVPLVKLMFYLPDRSPHEIRVAKTATVEQAIAAVLERSRDKLGRRKADRYEVRLHDSDGLPDDDFPALDRTSIISETGSTEFCLCDLRSDDDDDTDGGVAESPSPAPTVVESKVDSGSTALLVKSKSNAALGKGISRLRVDFVLEDTEVKHHDFPVRVNPGDTTVQQVLKRCMIKAQLPLLAEEYQLRIKEEDKERFGLVLTTLKPEDDLVALNIDVVELTKRKFVDAPPDLDKIDQLKTTAGKEARRQSEKNIVQKGEEGAAGDKLVKDQQADRRVPQVTINEQAVTTPAQMKSRDALMVKSTGKSSGKPASRQRPATTGMDRDAILLNEIKASMYEQWEVVKTNNWGKHQNRILGVDAHKLYNKPKTEGGFGGSVKHAERLIADVEDVIVNVNNPAVFTIKVREGLANNVQTLNYQAANPEDAAVIVAKIKYNMSRKPY